MIPAWIDRTVFCVTQADPAALDGAVRVGFNAVCVAPQDATTANDVAKSFVEAAHRRELRVCIDLSNIARSLDETIASWDDAGADALKLRGAGTHKPKLTHACIVADQHSVQPDVVSYLETTLFRASAGHAYFDAHGHGDFAAFWRVFGPLHSECGQEARIALGTSEHGGPSLRAGRELDDLEVIHTFLLTWPIVPFVASGDEGGAAFERMLYLRLTEGDLACEAALELLSPPSPGYPLLYRRGSAIVVALNPGATAQRVDLESVGDATPLVARHCHLAHTGGRWTARLGPAGYGVFNVA